MTATAASHTGLRRVATVVVALLLSSALVAALGSSAHAAPQKPSNPATHGSAGWGELRDIAERDGSVPLIVTLKAPGRLPHQLSADQLRNQKAAVARARGAVRRQMGKGKPQGLKTMDDLPLMAFHADAEQLAALKRSPDVAAVALDESHALPQPTGDGAKATSISGVAPAGNDSDQALAPAATTSNGLFNDLKSWWDYYRIGVNRSTAAGFTGAGQTVAILDTGVESNHAWLQGHVVAEACFSTVPGGYGGCPNGSWYQYGAGAAAPCRVKNCDHGTHVAHTAAGKYGVAPGARIIAVQVFHPTADGARANDSDITWALKYVYDLRFTYRIAALNMSLGGGEYSGYCDSSFTAGSAAANVGGWVRALYSVGIASTISSGNDDYRRYLGHPACFSHAISVGNTTLTRGGADAVFGNGRYTVNGKTYRTGSNSNRTLDLLAPGTDICSAVPGNRVNCVKGGTSMAAPHVAGAIAVLRQYRPSISIGQAQSALHRSGTRVRDSRNGITRSRIHVWNALVLLNARAGYRTASLSWTNPANGGAEVRMAAGRTAPGPNGGTRVYYGSGSRLVKKGLKPGRSYAFSVFPVTSNGKSQAGKAVVLRGSRAATVAPDRVRKGSRVLVRGVLRDAATRKGVRGRVVLQQRKAGRGSWVTVTARRTTAKGVAGFRVRPRATMQYRVRFAGAGRQLGTLSRPTKVVVVR